MRILILGIVAGFLWLGTTATAQAQRFRGWQGIANQFANPGNYNPGNFGNGFNGSGFNNGYFGNGYNNQYYGNGYNNNSNNSYNPSQRVALPVQSQTPPKGEAWIRVILPDADAELMFDGLKTSMVGRERTFSRNTHEAGDPTSYSYKASASWNQGGRLITDARTLVARPGQITVVDFTQPAPPEKLATPAR